MSKNLRVWLSDDVLAQITGTGIVNGGIISINVDNTKFDLSAGFGYIINNYTDPYTPTVNYVIWNNFTAVVDSYLSSNGVTNIAIDINGNIIQQNTEFTLEQSRDLIILGKTIHASRTVITNVSTNARFINNLPDDSYDLARSLGVINVFGNIYSPDGANLKLDKSEGRLHRVGISYGTSRKDPNTYDVSSQLALSFRYRYQDVTPGDFLDTATLTNVDPNNYDNGGGVLTPVPVGKFTVQRIYLFKDFTVITYGQALYDTLQSAVDGILTEMPVLDSNLEDAALRCYLVLKQGITSLQGVGDVYFSQSSKLGEPLIALGASGYSGVSGYSGYSGMSGYSGYSGLGYSGYSGNPGMSGYSGYSGLSGYSGNSGLSGYSGSTGDEGTSGYSGLGRSGYSGISGVSGYSGYSGISGISGYSGYSGYVGNSGYSGYSGVGKSGYSGLGASGYSGYSGISGYSGYSGISGYSGYSGISGISGSGVSGYSGYSGISGYSGYSGEGYSGYSGISGYSGLSGYSGISGHSGYSGITGYSGYSGTSGASGEVPGGSGYSGLSGYSGYSGTSGVSGASGEVPGGSGYSGLSGYSGYSGIDGQSGYSGISGASGEVPGGSGYSGLSGYSGYSGIDGQSGYSGISGYSGSGYSGYSGIIGYSGYSGISGIGSSGYSGSPGIGTSGYSGISGSSGGTEIRLIMNGDNTVQLLCAGPTLDLNNVTLTKVVAPFSPSVTITRPSTNVKYISLKAFWSVSDWGSSTSAIITFPETTGQTTLDTTQRPFAVRYTSSSYANGSPNSTVTNTAGVVSVAMPGFTAGQSNALQLIW